MKNIKIYYKLLLNVHIERTKLFDLDFHNITAPGLRFKCWNGSHGSHRRHDVSNLLVVEILHLKMLAEAN